MFADSAAPRRSRRQPAQHNALVPVHVLVATQRKLRTCAKRQRIRAKFVTPHRHPHFHLPFRFPQCGHATCANNETTQIQLSTVLTGHAARKQQISTQAHMRGAGVHSHLLSAASRLASRSSASSSIGGGTCDGATYGGAMSGARWSPPSKLAPRLPLPTLFGLRVLGSAGGT